MIGILGVHSTLTPHINKKMTEPITNIDDAYGFFYKSSQIIMRLKPHIKNEKLLSYKVERIKIHSSNLYLPPIYSEVSYMAFTHLL